ncbi:MAG: hypothetical protein SFV23_07255 [Planctomycetaceae bacterium]|nr:hypothetical protein [Planctomycetaceae bacterium]
MPAANGYWKSLRSHVAAITWSRKLMTVACSVLLPVFEAALVNIATGSTGDARSWAIGGLFIFGSLHIALFALLMMADQQTPAMHIVDAIELEEQVATLKRELHRRWEASKMIRSAFDALNLQTCESFGSGPTGIGPGLKRIMEQFSCGLPPALGITSSEYTFEVYFEISAIADTDDSQFERNTSTNVVNQSALLFPVYFYSTRFVDAELPFELKEKSPLSWGWGRHHSGQATLEDDRERFLSSGKPLEGTYFHRFATVPVRWACSDEQAGIFIVTSMQRDPFADDVIETMKFVASLLSQYHSAYNRCVYEWLAEQAREERARKARESRARAAQVMRDESEIDDTEEC